MSARWRLLLLVLAGPLVGSCDYVRLLRPSVLKQLNPRVVRLVNELPAVDRPNEALVARLLAHGGMVDARTGRDGVMRATIRAPHGQFIWEPAIVVMPRGGTLELDFSNEDAIAHHAAYLPDEGGREIVWLPVHTRGRARITLDAPGLYFFGCPVHNHAGRGMIGLVMVKGEVPAEAKLDRPPQRQPRGN